MGDHRQGRVTARTSQGLRVVVVVFAALTCASCSSSAPKPTPTSSAAHLTAAQVLPPLLQCFIDHRLISQSALQSGKDNVPPDDSATWMTNGKVTDNDRLGDWFSDNSALVVKGNTLGDWVTAVEANRNAWPTKVCGAMPAVK
jgi:hypothetical protein